eukprot:749481-Hanusia_phi.AAC.18
MRSVGERVRGCFGLLTVVCSIAVRRSNEFHSFSSFSMLAVLARLTVGTILRGAINLTCNTSRRHTALSLVLSPLSPSSSPEEQEQQSQAQAQQPHHHDHQLTMERISEKLLCSL